MYGFLFVMCPYVLMIVRFKIFFLKNKKGNHNENFKTFAVNKGLALLIFAFCSFAYLQKFCLLLHQV